MHVLGSELSQYFLDERGEGQQAGVTSPTTSTTSMKQIFESHLFQLFWFHRQHWESRLYQYPPVDWCHSYLDPLKSPRTHQPMLTQSPQAAALQKHGLDCAILPTNTNWTKQSTPQPSLHLLGTHRRYFRNAPVVRYHCSHHHSQGGLMQGQLSSM